MLKGDAARYLSVQCGRGAPWVRVAFGLGELVVPAAEGSILPAARRLPITVVIVENATIMTLHEYLHFGLAFNVLAVSVPVRLKIVKSNGSMTK